MSKKIFNGLNVFLLANLIGISANAYELSQAKAVDLDQVNTALNAYGAGWQAKENWVSQLSVAQVKRMLGARNVDDHTFQFRAKEPLSSVATSNAALDWRNVNGVNWVTPVLNQGNCGSCVAFATVGTVESQMQISAKLPTLNPRLSAEAIFECGGGSCDMGWQPDDAEAYLTQFGVPDAACMPYTSGATGNDADCSTACSDMAARSIKTNPSQTRTVLGSVAAVKQALSHGPVETTLTVYADFLTYSSGVYKHVTGDALGGHAVSIVGYDDSQQAWIVRNSWGTAWGNNGYILVSYTDTSGVAQEVWGFEPQSEAGYIAFDTPSDRQILSGVASLAIASTVDPNSTLNYTIEDPTGKTIIQKTVQGIPENISFDTTTLKDGQYQIYATAVTPSNVTINSLHVEFYVLNSKPTGSLSFTPDGFDISQPLTDRVVFDVAAPSTPVPYSTLTLHVQQNGKDVFTNFIDTVLPNMTFGWRTNEVPNGTYDVFMTADITVGSSDALHVESTHVTVTTQN